MLAVEENGISNRQKKNYLRNLNIVLDFDAKTFCNVYKQI